MIIKIKANRKILKDIIVRKRLRVANFYKQHVKKERINYVFCIPANGLSSSVIQQIRLELNKYGYKIAKYTTNSFLEKLNKNGIFLDQDQAVKFKEKNEDKEQGYLSQFYLGQMLIVTIAIACSPHLTSRAKQLDEEKCLTFLHSFLKNINYSTYFYFCSTSSTSEPAYPDTLNESSNSSHFLVTQPISKDALSQFLGYKNVITFSTITSSIVNFLALLLQTLIVLLNMLLIKGKSVIV